MFNKMDDEVPAEATVNESMTEIPENRESPVLPRVPVSAPENDPLIIERTSLVDANPIAEDESLLENESSEPLNNDIYTVIDDQGLTHNVKKVNNSWEFLESDLENVPNDQFIDQFTILVKEGESVAEMHNSDLATRVSEEAEPTESTDSSDAAESADTAVQDGLQEQKRDQKERQDIQRKRQEQEQEQHGTANAGSVLGGFLQNFRKSRAPFPHDAANADGSQPNSPESQKGQTAEHKRTSPKIAKISEAAISPANFNITLDRVVDFVKAIENTDEFLFAEKHENPQILTDLCSDISRANEGQILKKNVEMLQQSWPAYKKSIDLTKEMDGPTCKKAEVEFTSTLNKLEKVSNSKLMQGMEKTDPTFFKRLNEQIKDIAESITSMLEKIGKLFESITGPSH